MLNTILNSRSKVIAALSILALLWVGNLVYFYNHQLTRPLVMDHYYEISLDDSWQDYDFPLFYLANRMINQEIVQIEFPGSDIQLNVENRVHKTFDFHVIKEMHVQLS